MYFIQMTQNLYNWWKSDKLWSAPNVNSNLNVKRTSALQYLNQAFQDFNTDRFSNIQDAFHWNNSSAYNQRCVEMQVCWNTPWQSPELRWVCGKQPVKPFFQHTSPWAYSKDHPDLELHPYLRIETSEKQKKHNSTISKSQQKTKDEIQSSTGAA